MPIFTWKCNQTVIIPALPIFLPDNIAPTPLHPPPRQLLLRLPSGERLTTAYQPLAHHTAGTVAQREWGEARDRDEREEELMKEGRMAKEM